MAKITETITFSKNMNLDDGFDEYKFTIKTTERNIDTIMDSIKSFVDMHRSSFIDREQWSSQDASRNSHTE